MCRVLVVEDEAPAARGIVKLLRDDGYEAASVGTAREAIDTLTRVAVDVVLLDLGLPDMDGVEALRRLRTTAAVDVAVVVLTGYPERRAEVAALDPRALFLAKPALGPAVLAAVHEAAVARANRLMTRIGSDPAMPNIRKLLDDTVESIRAQQRRGSHGGRSG